MEDVNFRKGDAKHFCFGITFSEIYIFHLNLN